MARPKILCPACSQEILPGSKFCSSCGTSIDWDGASTPAPVAAQQTTATPKTAKVSGPGIKCPLCGFENSPGVVDCNSCGAALPGAVRSTVQETPRTTVASPSSGLDLMKMFQSGKLIIVVVVVLIAVLVGMQFFNSTKPAAVKAGAQPGGPMPGQMGQPGGEGAMDPQKTAEIAKQIDALQKQADDNPSDAQVALHLANALQDARIPDRAIDSYKKYLALKPDDANAIVDMGVCYYDIAGSDSTVRMKNLDISRQLFEKALGMDPRHQMAMFNLGIVSLMSGDLHVATQWFKKTVATDSTTDVGRRANMLLTQHSFGNKPS